MRGWIRDAVGCVALACGVASVAYAQDDISRVVGRPVATIHFEVEGRSVTSAELDSLVPLKAGDALRLEAIRDAESHLINAGRYENVRVTVTDGPVGLDLLFSLTPRHPVDRLEVTGDTGLARSELENLIRQRYGGLPAREPPDAVGQVVTGLLRDEGYPDARLLAMGITINFFLYIMINGLMVMGLLPVVGIPMPMVSYGGTAMMTVMFGFGLLMSVHVHRHVEVPLRASGML